MSRTLGDAAWLTLSALHASFKVPTVDFSRHGWRWFEQRLLLISPILYRFPLNIHFIKLPLTFEPSFSLLTFTYLNVAVSPVWSKRFLQAHYGLLFTIILIIMKPFFWRHCWWLSPSGYQTSTGLTVGSIMLSSKTFSIKLAFIYLNFYLFCIKLLFFIILRA